MSFFLSNHLVSNGNLLIETELSSEGNQVAVPTMFEHFDSQLFSDPNFKEDSVREVIIAPILSRLGYHSTGDQTVARSKSLVQPFIYVGTRRHPVTDEAFP